MNKDVIEYNEYTIHCVYGRMTHEQQQAVITMWQRNNILPNPSEAYRRVNQVVMMATNPDGEAVGVSTIYPQLYQGNNQWYWFYRMFVQPGDRDYGLTKLITVQTYDFLKQYQVENKPAGLVIITENRKLMRKGLRRLLSRIGFEYVGQDRQGQDVWLGRW